MSAPHSTHPAAIACVAGIDGTLDGLARLAKAA